MLGGGGNFTCEADAAFSAGAVSAAGGVKGDVIGAGEDIEDAFAHFCGDCLGGILADDGEGTVFHNQIQSPG